jgi:hypothetical protein
MGTVVETGTALIQRREPVKTQALFAFVVADPMPKRDFLQ